MTVFSRIAETDLAAVPEPVARYLRRTGVVGRRPVQTVMLRQRGRFRLKPDGAWAALRAVQRYTVDPPAFVWHATISPWAFTPVKVVDAFTQGHGRLVARLWGLVPIARACGPQTDAGELLRFLGEIAWFPTAWLSPNITWSVRDDRSATATISSGGVSVSGTLCFDDGDRIVGFEAIRHRIVGRSFTLDQWQTPLFGHNMVNGLLIPLKGKAIWKLQSGDFEYFDGEVTSLEYVEAIPDRP